MAAEIKVTADLYAIRIHIGGVLHIHLDRLKFLGLNSWYDHAASYSIEYLMVGGSMMSEYTERERWVTILAGLERVLT